MSSDTNYYIGEIIMFAGPLKFGPPAGFLVCNGALLNITDYTALFALIGTTYGGDGGTKFALPDFRGVFPFGADAANCKLGQRQPSAYPANGTPPTAAGSIAQSNLPSLTASASIPTQKVNVPIKATTLTGGAGTPVANAVLGSATGGAGAANIYLAPTSTPIPDANLVSLDGGSLQIPATTVTVTIPGSGNPVSFPVPSLAINFLICTTGLYPSPY